MKYYYFYKPETAKIVGMSDNPQTMEFPYIESEEDYHSLDNLRILDGKLVPIKGILTEEDVMKFRTRRSKGKLDQIRSKIIEKKEKGEKMKQDEILDLFLDIINNT